MRWGRRGRARGRAVGVDRAQEAAAADRGLLDEIVVTIAPVTLGGGAPLLPRRVELVRTEWAVNGEFVCVRYDVVKGRSA